MKNARTSLCLPSCPADQAVLEHPVDLSGYAIEIIEGSVAVTMFTDETYSVGVDHALDGVHEGLRIAFIVNGRLRS